MDWIYFLIVGALAGYLSSRFMGRPDFGCFGNTVLGVIGGMVGGYVFDFLDIDIEGGFLASILVSFVGAVAVLFTANLLSGRR